MAGSASYSNLTATMTWTFLNNAAATRAIDDFLLEEGADPATLAGLAAPQKVTLARLHLSAYWKQKVRVRRTRAAAQTESQAVETQVDLS